MERFASLARWEPTGLGPYETVRARSMHRVLVFAVPLIVASAVAVALSGAAALVAFPALAFVVYGTSIALLVRGRQPAAAAVVLTGSFALLAVGIAPFGGVRGPIPVELVACSALAVSWLDRRFAWPLVAALAAVPLATVALGPVPSMLDEGVQRLSEWVSSTYATTVIGALVALTADALQAIGTAAEGRQREARRADKAARAAIERKSRFLASMSHELRTPLNAILGYAGLLKDDGRDHDDLERIEIAGGQLVGMVDELLERARAEAAAMSVDPPDEAPLDVNPARLRARLLRSAFVTLAIPTVLASTLQAILPPLRPLLVSTLPLAVVLVTGAWCATTGRDTATRVLAGLFAWAVLVAVWATGGPESRIALYLPVVSIVVWGAASARAGFAFLLATEAVLVAWYLGFAGPLVAPGPWPHAIACSIAVALSAVVMSVLTGALRRFAEEAHRRASRAEAAAASARADEVARDRFLAQVSHDLRTPLDAVLGYTELLREEERDDVRLEDLDKIRSASLQLLALVDDLIDLARQSADDIALSMHELRVEDVVRSVVDTTAPLVAASGSTLTVAIHADHVWTDERRLRQILLNLVSNAAKYSEGGPIRIDVTREGPRLWWAVRDSGRGLYPDQLARLFRPFVQVHEGAAQRPGLGLGLALSQRLARRLGGRIVATSHPGYGSTFILQIPVDPRDSSESGATEDGGLDAADSGVR